MSLITHYIYTLRALIYRIYLGKWLIISFKMLFNSRCNLEYLSDKAFAAYINLFIKFDLNKLNSFKIYKII